MKIHCQLKQNRKIAKDDMKKMCSFVRFENMDVQI